MKQQMKRDFWSARVLIVFFTVMVPTLSLIRGEFTTMGLLLSAFLLGILVLNDEKFRLNKFINSLPTTVSEIYRGRIALVTLFGILWVLLEIMPLAITGNVPWSAALTGVAIQGSMLLILVPSSLSSLTLIEGKIARWLPVVVSYFILILAALLFTDIFYALLVTSEENLNTVFTSLIALVLFSMAYMYLSSRMYRRRIAKRDKV